MRIIFSVVRIVAGVLIFVFLVLPIKSEVDSLKSKKSELTKTEVDAKEYAALGQDVIDRFQSLDPAQVDRLKKMVPDSVDNVRFINDLNGLAKRSGMTLKKVDYNPGDIKGTSTNVGVEHVDQSTHNLPYGSYTLKFSATGSYTQFLTFLEALENSLRLLDITAITFKAETTPGTSKNDIYEFSLTTKAYWLKN